jgi:hypothetical protein
MEELRDTNIIAFPDRSVAPRRDKVADPATAEAISPEARLARALAGLNEAVNTQREAITAWRAALGDLQTVTGRLGESLRTYHDNLGNLSSRVARLRTESVKLATWADGVLANEG